MLSTRFKVLREFPLGLAIMATPDTEAAALRRLLPLVQRAKRSEEEGRVRLGLLDEAQNLDGFAEAHLIAEKATARLKSFTVFHPYHTLLLVLLVLKAIPKGDKVLLFSMFTSCTDLIVDAIKTILPDFQCFRD
jgi:hypothetical protein